MPEFRIFRMKDHVRARFRNAPHTSGESPAKLIDYVESGKVEAANAYEAWESLRGSEDALQVGDLLETELGALKIYKYVGFEDAKWIVPETPVPQPTAGPSTL
ncbi:MAG: hypothetical protein FJW30_15750 [Acidobacteria bacterium]|nr:hypothetical protein [Acidobacteriota bacterium]